MDQMFAWMLAERCGKFEQAILTLTAANNELRQIVNELGKLNGAEWDQTQRRWKSTAPPVTPTPQ